MIKSKRSLQTYIILLNWNNYQDTLECLESLFKQDYKEFKIILCDNDSTDGSVEHFINWAEGKELSITPKNSFLQSLVKPAIKKPISFCVFNREQAETNPDFRELRTHPRETDGSLSCDVRSGI